MDKITKKKKIVLGIAVVIYIVLFYLLIYRPYMINKNKKIKIITSRQVLISYKEEKWDQQYINSGLYENYTIMLDNKRFGVYNIMPTSSRLYLKNKKDDLIDFTGDLFAYNSNVKIKLFKNKYKFTNNIDEYISQFMDENSLKIENKKDLYYERITVDLNQDKKDDYVYFLSTAFNKENNSDTLFSSIFVVDNGKINVIEFEKFDKKRGLDSRYAWGYVNGMKFYKDNLLIIRQEFYSMSHKPCVLVYQIKGKKYTNLMSCNN